MRYLTGSRKREAAIQNALLDRLAARFERTVARQLSRTMNLAIKQYKADKSDFGVEAVIRNQDNKLAGLMSVEINNVMTTFGERILNNGSKTLKDMGDDPFDDAVRNYFKIYGLQHVQMISSTTVNQIRQLINQGEVEGLGVDEIARNIVKQIPTISRYRANAIARTETHTAANFGSQAAAESTGLNILKEWLAANDERTREEHSAADGQTVALNETFEVGGEDLMFPGDPSGSAENIINCFSGDTLVSFKSCKKAIRSLYTGEMITIKTSAGHKITGTPNHPVMTTSGLIRLDQINHETNLLCCPINKNFSGAFDVKHIPAKFEDVFNSASIVGVVMGMGTVSVNLYDRVPKGQVSVVDINGSLRQTLFAKQFQSQGKLLFKKANFAFGLLFGLGLLNRNLLKKTSRFVFDGLVSRLNLSFSFVCRHLLPFKCLGFGLASNVNTGLGQSAPNNGSRTANGLSDLVFAKARLIQSHSPVFHKNPMFNFDSPIGSPDNIQDSGSANAELLAKFRATHSRFVETDKPVLINREFFHDLPVYTLETNEGFYNAGGIIAGNCRCSVAYITE